MTGGGGGFICCGDWWCARNAAGGWPGPPVAERDIRPGRRGVLHLSAQLVAEHDRRVLGVGRTAEEKLPTGDGVIPAGDPNLVGTAGCP